MRAYLIVLSLVLLLTSCATQNGGNKPLNVLILGQVSDDNYTGNYTGVYRRISRAIAAPIDEAGHNVYDETLVTLDDFEITRNLNGAEARDIARSTNPRMDVVVIFEFSSSARSRESSRQVRINIDASALSVSSGRNMGNTSNSDSFRVPPNCQGRCLRDRISDAAGELAEEAGAVIAAKLGDAGNPAPRKKRGRGIESAFEISLQGFRRWEAHDIEDSLTELRGYEEHRVQFSNSRRTDIWYETNASVSQISRHLEGIFNELGVNAHVQFSGNTFRVTKTTPRKKREAKDDTNWQW